MRRTFLHGPNANWTCGQSVATKEIPLSHRTGHGAHTMYTIDCYIIYNIIQIIIIIWRKRDVHGRVTLTDPQICSIRRSNDWCKLTKCMAAMECARVAVPIFCAQPNAMCTWLSCSEIKIFPTKKKTEKNRTNNVYTIQHTCSELNKEERTAAK